MYIRSIEPNIILNNLSASIIVIDKDFNITYVNKRALDLMPKILSSGVNSSIEAFISNFIKKELTCFLKMNVPKWQFIKNFWSSKKDFYLTLEFNNIFDENNTNYIMITIQNIEEYKIPEKLTEKFNALFKAQSDLYFILDKKGNFLDFEARNVDDLYVSSQDCIIGKNIDDLIPPETALLHKNALKKAYKTKSLVTIEYSLNLKKGTQFFEANFFPFVNNKIIQLVRNISNQKQLDEELLKIEKLNSIGTLAGGVAHDFNNILTIILGNISLLKTYINKNPKAIKNLENIENTIYNAKNLTKQLLTFSKGGKPIKKIISLKPLVEETASFTLSGSNVICKLSFSSNLWSVEVDRSQIRQVFSNLIINSVQSMPNGGQIRIRASNIELKEKQILNLKAGKYIKISLSDQGIGIPKENLSKIFDPYFTTKKTGNGLGLATVYSVINKHNGYISVKSKLGHGTIFYIYLPALNCIPIEIKPKEIIPVKGKGKILIMDDEIEIHKVLSSMLRNLGYTVISSKDGQEAINKYIEAQKSNNPFDAIIMDLTIPGGMGGEEATKQLLQINPTLKAIISSGYSSNDVLSNYKNYGFKGIINKPYTLEELSIKLSSVLNDR